MCANMIDALLHIPCIQGTFMAVEIYDYTRVFHIFFKKRDTTLS